MILTLVITLVIGFLSNDEKIIPALNPSGWGHGRPLYVPAWIVVMLAPAAIVLALYDYRQRRGEARLHRNTLSEMSNQQASAASEQRLLRAQVATLTTENRQERTRRAALDEELLHRTSSIEVSLRSTTTRTYLPGLDEAVRDSHAALLLVLNSPKSKRKYADVLAAVRYVLYAAANLVKTYEGRHVGVLYTANLMMFRSTSSLTAAHESELRQYMLAPDLYRDWSSLRGVLELRDDLTASTEVTSEIRPDRRIGRLVLPIPLRYSEPVSLAFPGAPTAFCRKSMDVCPNVFDLPDRCEREGVLPTQMKDVLRSYFEERASHVKSFISLPLFRAHDEHSPCGVVNINSSLTGLLREQPRQEQLLPHLRTLLWNLPEMITELDSIPQNRRTTTVRRSRGGGRNRRE